MAKFIDRQFEKIGVFQNFINNKNSIFFLIENYSLIYLL